tara:strand:+ start:251 stop:460 length:210 start_codon:yes stop_codon:yes gene_type:complete
MFRVEHGATGKEHSELHHVSATTKEAARALLADRFLTATGVTIHDLNPFTGPEARKREARAKSKALLEE